MLQVFNFLDVKTLFASSTVCKLSTQFINATFWQTLYLFVFVNPVVNISCFICVNLLSELSIFLSKQKKGGSPNFTFSWARLKSNNDVIVNYAAELIVSQKLDITERRNFTFLQTRKRTFDVLEWKRCSVSIVRNAQSLASERNLQRRLSHCSATWIPSPSICSQL